MQTEVMLMADVKFLGKAGEIVKVAPGYARNKLLPQGLAAPVTEASRRRLAKLEAQAVQGCLHGGIVSTSLQIEEEHVVAERLLCRTRLDHRDVDASQHKTPDNVASHVDRRLQHLHVLVAIAAQHPVHLGTTRIVIANAHTQARIILPDRLNQN